MKRAIAVVTVVLGTGVLVLLAYNVLIVGMNPQSAVALFRGNLWTLWSTLVGAAMQNKDWVMVIVAVLIVAISVARVPKLKRM